MPDPHFYYSETGEKIPLEPLEESLSIAYRGEVPPKDLDALIKEDEALSDFVFSKELQNRHMVIYKRRPSAKVSLEAFADRLLKSDQVAYVSPVYRLDDEPIVVTDEFIASFKATVSHETIDELNATNQVELVLDEGLHLGPNTFLLRVKDPGPRGALDMANRYFETGLVEYAVPNFIQIVSMTSPFRPNDALFPRQWHLPRIKAEEAWDITRGDPAVIVAVLDQGIDIDHEDFASPGKFASPRDFFAIPVDNDPRPPAGSAENHGTAVAGLALADGNNTIGVSGVAPGCRFMPIRILSDGPNALPVTISASGIRFAADNGAAVLSNSWRASPLLPPLRAAIDHATNTGRGGKGCVVCFGSGNANGTVVANSAVAAYQRVIAVAAHNDKNVRSGYSDFGPEVSICAPSDGTSFDRALWQELLGTAFQEDGSTLGMVTTDRMGPVEGNNAPSGVDSNGNPDPRQDPLNLSVNYTSTFGGTSAACPVAAGVTALMLSVNPDLTFQQVRFVLEATADKIDATNTDPIGRYQPNGHSQWYGFGRVNAFEAVKNARASIAAGDFVQRVFVTLRRTTGDRFVSTRVFRAIDARQRRADTANDNFIRSGPDGFLRATLPSNVAPFSKEAEVNP